MNTEFWNPLYVFYAIVLIPLILMAIGLKFYEFYSNRKEQQLIKAKQDLIWKTL